MFYSLTSGLRYTKIYSDHSGGEPERCELRKISDTELNFLTIKPIL